MSTKFLSTADGSIAYDETGSGPLVICVPSMGDLRHEYRFLAPQLVAAGFRVATMDVRGHGESSTGWPDYSVAGVGRDLLSLASHLGGGPAIVIGSSMAAGAAVWAAVEAPQAIRCMVLIGPFVRSPTGVTNSLMQIAMSAMLSRPWGPAAWQSFYSRLYPTRKPDDYAAYSARLRANMSEPGRLEALQAMVRASKDASEARLPRVATPALVLMGSMDPDFADPVREAAWVAEAVRGRHTLVKNAGHYPHAEFPTETAAAILTFVASVE